MKSSGRQARKSSRFFHLQIVEHELVLIWLNFCDFIPMLLGEKPLSLVCELLYIPENLDKLNWMIPFSPSLVSRIQNPCSGIAVL